MSGESGPRGGDILRLLARTIAPSAFALLVGAAAGCGNQGGDSTNGDSGGFGQTGSGGATASGVSGGADGATGNAGGSTGFMVTFGSTGGTGSSATTTGRDACVDVDVPLDGVPPTVILLVDQSISMNDKFGSGTRWSVLHDALMDPTTGVVARVQDRVKFGLALYSSHNGYQDGGQCPILHEVPSAISNYDAIEAVYGPAKPFEDTPTGDSIKVITGELTALPPGPKYILLVTDGLPDTCTDPDPATSKAQANANAYTVKAAQDAFTQGIGLIMMGVSQDIAPQHLQDMANAGAGLPVGSDAGPNAKYYVASSDQQQLAAQLLEAVGKTQSCVFDLNGTVDSTAVGRGTVSLCENPSGCATEADRVTLVYNDPNGWTLKTSSQVELVGTACENVKNGVATGFQATFPCGVFHPRVQ